MELLDPSNAGVLAIIILAAQLIGKIIPDSAQGPLGFIRSVAKVIGAYVPNRK